MKILSEIKIKLNEHKFILLLLLTIPLFYLIAIKVVDPINYPNSDFFSLWLAGRFAFLGQDPYIANTWIEAHHQFGASWISDPTFLYPLPLSILFIPLGLLPLYSAFITWVVLSQVMIFASILLLLRLLSNKRFGLNLLFLIVFLALFIPTTVTLSHGQLTGLFLFVLASILYLWEKGKWWQGSFLLPLLALKPNFGIPIIVLLCIFLILKKKKISLLFVGGSSLMLLVLGILQNVNWIREFLTIGNNKVSQTFGFSPTIWGGINLLCNSNQKCSIGIGICVCLLILIGVSIIEIEKSKAVTPSMAVGLAIILTLLMTPYTWAYDQLLLLIPIAVIIFSLSKSDSGFLPKAIILFGIVLIGMISAYLSISVFQNGISYVLIPITVFFLFVWCLLKL